MEDRLKGDGSPRSGTQKKMNDMEQVEEIRWAGQGSEFDSRLARVRQRVRTPFEKKHARRCEKNDLCRRWRDCRRDEDG